MKRLVYAFDTADSARAAIDELRGFGVDDKCISLIARSEDEGGAHESLQRAAPCSGWS